MKFKISRLVSLTNLEFNFFIAMWSILKETLHYYKYMVCNITKFAFSVKQFSSGYENNRSKYDVEKLAIWQHSLISGKHRHTLL